LLAWLCSFQGPHRDAPRTGARSLKTQQHEALELMLGRPQVRPTFR
jgi:hypothetical protein